LFGAIVFALRRRSWKCLFFFAPVNEALVLALVSFAQDFRYQFAIYPGQFFLAWD